MLGTDGSEEGPSERARLQESADGNGAGPKRLVLQTRGGSGDAPHFFGEGSATPRPQDPDDAGDYRPNQAATESPHFAKMLRGLLSPAEEAEVSPKGSDREATLFDGNVSVPGRSKSARHLGHVLGSFFSKKHLMPHSPTAQHSPREALRAKSLSSFPPVVIPEQTAHA
jgi:hypothetical protein